MLKTSRFLRNRKGLATLEMIPVMVVIALMLNFSLGFFGVIHTGILNSMAARNYTFETFRNRTNLVYFHDIRGTAGANTQRHNTRVHSIISDLKGTSTSSTVIAYATSRPIGFGQSPEDGSVDDHDSTSAGRGVSSVSEGQRNKDVSTAPVWVRPMYGICLNAKCKD